MKVTGKGTIYHNQYGYVITDNQRKVDGTWENFYIPVSFPREMRDLPHNRDFIEINGYTKPYKYKDGKLGISYMVLSWTLLKMNNSTSVNAPQGEQNVKTDEKVKNDPYQDFGNEFVLTEDDLPF